MNFGSRIYDMLDELDKAEQGREEYSKYSIIEKYFKKIGEDTKKECARKAENYCTANPDTARLFDSGMAVASKEIAEEIEKL